MSATELCRPSPPTSPRAPENEHQKKKPKKTKLDADRLSLHVGETTLTLPFTPQQGAELEDALNALLKTFADKAKAERPRRWEMMEVAWKGGGGAEPELLELVCNPNAYRFVCFVLRLCRQATPRIRAAAAVANNPTTPHARPPPPTISRTTTTTTNNTNALTARRLTPSCSSRCARARRVA